MRSRVVSALAACCLCLGPAAFAGTRPDSHAPIGVMGDHYHKHGELMFSYRFMTMSMKDNLDGSSSLSPEEIATTVPNRFAGVPGQPPTLRVVPTEMTMDMHMFGVMWAPSDRVTLMGMFDYVEKEMDHTTFAGGGGTAVLGGFTTKSSGWGDTSLVALVKLREREHSRWHATAGLSIPTGDVEESGTVLAPNGMQPDLRLPYPMQLGSGTYDPIVGLTYSGASPRFGWGAQWRGLFRSGDNGEDYSLGDEHRWTGWGSYLLSPIASLSGRIELFRRGNVDGMDPAIVAPVQTADPGRQAARRVDAGLGVNFLLPGNQHRFAIEALLPVDQDLDGPQLETDWRIVLGYQFTIY